MSEEKSSDTKREGSPRYSSREGPAYKPDSAPTDEGIIKGKPRPSDKY